MEQNGPDRIDPARVRKRRKDDLGISQKELARRIERAGFGDLNYQSIGQLEAGDVENPSYAKYLAEALDTTWEYLIGKTDNPVGVVNGSLGNNMRQSGYVPREVRDKEGPYMLGEIQRMLGVMEGSMKATFGARFDRIDERLEDHGRRIEALEGRPMSGPQKGRRR
jgi:transcriptional regulator with XRE-family HTH domain